MQATASDLVVPTAGDRFELFEELLRKTYPQAFNLAMRLTGSRTDAEDLVQESFVRAYRFFHRYDASLPFTSWLFRILTNAHIDEMRRRGNLKSSSLDEPHPETGVPIEVADGQPSIEARLISQQMDSDIQEGLSKMTTDFRIAVLLADLEGLSYEEIAEVMNTSIGTVRSRIHRGRKQLRTYLVKTHPSKYAHLDAS